MQYTQLFETGSVELTKFLEKNAVGKTLPSPEGSKVWTILEVDITDDIPPNPMTGQKSTKVSLTLGS